METEKNLTSQMTAQMSLIVYTFAAFYLEMKTSVSRIKLYNTRSNKCYLVLNIFYS